MKPLPKETRKIRKLPRTVEWFNQGCSAYQKALWAWEEKDVVGYETGLLRAARDVPDALEWALKIYLGGLDNLAPQDRAKLKEPSFSQLMELMARYADPAIEREEIKHLYGYRTMRNESTHKGTVPSMEEVGHAINDIRRVMLTYLPLEEENLRAIDQEESHPTDTAVEVVSGLAEDSAENVVFVSYSHKNEVQKNRLLSHLRVIEQAGLIELWSDDQIGVGTDWQAEITGAIDRARVAVLLVSADFLSSDFILNREIPALLQRRQKNGLVVYPVIARACAWQTVAWLADMQVRPKNGRPVWSGSDSEIDTDLAAIAAEIAGIFDPEDSASVEILPRKPAPPPLSNAAPASGARPYVFLSYNKGDESFVETIATRLKADNRCTFWFAPWHSQPGLPIMEQMEEALLEASACAVFVSGGAGQISGWPNEQLRLAIQNRVEDEPGYRVIPILIPGMSRPTRRDMPPLLRRYEWVEYQSSDDEQAYRRRLAGILGVPPIEVDAPSLVVEPEVGVVAATTGPVTVPSPSKTSTIPQLEEALNRRSLLLFIGADLPEAVTGLPSRRQLAGQLAQRHGLDESLSLAEVAQRVGQAGNRWEFTNFIRTALDTTGKAPAPFHQRMAALAQAHQIELIISTGYDNLLEQAFQQAGLGLNRVVRGGDVGFIDPQRPTLIKLYGDAQQPETLVITDQDHSGLLRDRDKEALLEEVRRALRRNTALFVGYNLADPDFRFIFDQVAESSFARLAYAVWSGLPPADIQMWRDRGIVILEADPLGVL